MSQQLWAEPPAEPAPIAEVADLLALVRAGAAKLDAGQVPAGLDPLAVGSDPKPPSGVEADRA